MLVSYVILTCNRWKDLERCLNSIEKQDYPDIEIVVIDNNSSDGTPDLISKYPKVKYRRLDYNSGVCQGRNIGFQEASGEIIIVIDDDGELPRADTTAMIVAGFQKRPDMGIMALRVINPRDLNCRRVIPSRDKSIARRREEVPVAYFPGGGMAVRSALLDEVGMFPAEYFYSMEELDLAYRVARTDWQIYYFPQIAVLHHESLQQRPSWRRFYYEYRNRIWLATSFLPLPYLVVNLTLWGGWTLVRALRHGHIRPFLRGVADAIKGLRFARLRRKDMLLRPPHIRRIKALGGRLYY